MSALFTKRKIVLLVTVLVFIFAVLSVTLKDRDGRTEIQAEHFTPVKVVKAEKGSLEKTLRLNGYVQSDNIVTVVPFVAGTLDRLDVKLGDNVYKGQLIGKIDSKAYDLQLKQAEAAYFGAKSSYERVEQLYKSGATTKQTYDQTKSQYDAYKSQYELAELQVSYTNIESPIDGTVLVIHTNEGSIAAPERPLITIGDLTDLIVKLNIPEKYYELFRTAVDMNITIERPGDQNIYKAFILALSPIIDAETKNFEVTCGISGNVSGLRPGMFVYCTFVTDSIDDIWYLPQKVFGPGKTLWYVDKSDSTARKADLPDIFVNSDFFAVPDNVADLDFIMEGQSFLAEGQKVSIINLK